MPNGADEPPDIPDSECTESACPGGSIRPALRDRFARTHDERSRASRAHCVGELERCPASRAGVRAA
jgi:hypothetical protein